MNTFSFDHLSEVEFEEFCYDLLASLGAERLSWRKGTGLQTSPADQGRDIECYFIKREPDGGHRDERWFVECKHFKQGVPPTSIQGAIAWATAERPDVLLIVASNALSNPCKAYLETLMETNKPQFRLKIWEHKDLENLTVGKPDLLRKYRMTDDFPFLKLLHPAHVLYIRQPPLNTLKYFFAILEKAGPHRFHDALGFGYMMVLKPPVKLPTDGNQTLRDLIQAPISYVDFRQKCFDLARIVEQSFIVRAIINEALPWAFRAGDRTDLDRVVQNRRFLVQSMEQELKGRPDETVFTDRDIEEMKARIERLPAQIEGGYRNYISFCEEVVAPLFSEDVQFPPEVIAQMEKITGRQASSPKRNA